MGSLAGAVAFFDIGNTLASVAVSPSGDRIERLTAYPYVPPVLAALRDRDVRLGIVSDRGPIPEENVNQALVAAGLWDFFAPELVVYGRKDSPRVFELAARRAGAPEPGRLLLFVGEDAAERAQALRADFVVAPHPRLALPVLEQHAALRYVRVTVPHGQAGSDWRAALNGLPVVPLHVSGEAQTTVFAIATAPAAARLDDLGFWVDRLGVEDEPLTTDLYLLRDDRQLDSGFLQPDGNSSSFFQTGTRLTTHPHLHRGGAVRRPPRGPLGRELSLPGGPARAHPEAGAVCHAAGGVRPRRQPSSRGGGGGIAAHRGHPQRGGEEDAALPRAAAAARQARRTVQRCPTGRWPQRPTEARAFGRQRRGRAAQ